MEALYQLSYSPLRKANITVDEAVRKIVPPRRSEALLVDVGAALTESSSNRCTQAVAYDHRYG